LLAPRALWIGSQILLEGVAAAPPERSEAAGFFSVGRVSGTATTPRS